MRLGAARVVMPPVVDAADDGTEKENEQTDEEEEGNPLGGGQAMFGLRGNGSNLGAVRQIVFAEKSLFIEAEVARDGANEATIEHAARELAPIFVFQGFQKARANARGCGNLLQRDFAKLALTLQTFSEISPSHAVSL